MTNTWIGVKGESNLFLPHYFEKKTYIVVWYSELLKNIHLLILQFKLILDALGGMILQAN